MKFEFIYPMLVKNIGEMATPSDFRSQFYATVGFRAKLYDIVKFTMVQFMFYSAEF